MLGKIIFIVGFYTIVLFSQDQQRLLLYDNNPFWDYTPQGNINDITIINDNIFIPTNYSKQRNSIDTLSRKPPILKITISKYETNFSTYDSTLVTDTQVLSPFVLNTRLYRYGSEVIYNPVLTQINKSSTITKVGSAINYKIPDIGCLYDMLGYPLVDIDNNILYPNN